MVRGRVTLLLLLLLCLRVLLIVVVERVLRLLLLLLMLLLLLLSVPPRQVMLGNTTTTVTATVGYATVANTTPATPRLGTSLRHGHTIRARRSLRVTAVPLRRTGTGTTATAAAADSIIGGHFIPNRSFVVGHLRVSIISATAAAPAPVVRNATVGVSIVTGVIALRESES